MVKRLTVALVTAFAVLLVPGAVGTATAGAPPTSPWDCRWSTTCLDYSGWNPGTSHWGQAKCDNTRWFNCTNYVAYRLEANGVPSFMGACGQPHGSNAQSWDERARGCGIRVDTTPAPGAVIQWDGYAPFLTGGGSYSSAGHVAYIDAVQGSTVYISQAACSLKKGSRVAVTWPIPGVGTGAVEVLHPKDLAGSSSGSTAIRDGDLVRTPDGAVYVVAGGAKYHLSPGEYADLGRPAFSDVSATALDSYSFVPRSGSFLRDPVSTAIYEVVGGVAYHVSAAEYAALGRPTSVNVPAGFIARAGADTPDGVWFLRDPVSTAIYEVIGGMAYHVSAAEYAALGRPSSLNVPAGFLAHVSADAPDGVWFLRDPVSTAIYEVVGGMAYHLSAAEYASLDRPEPVAVPAGLVASIPSGVPSGVWFLRDPVSTAIYEVVGGAKYYLSAAEYASLDRPEPVAVPAGLVASIPSGVPSGVWFLRDPVSTAIYKVSGGTKYHLSATEYAALGRPGWFGAPAGWLADIPDRAQP